MRLTVLYLIDVVAVGFIVLVFVTQVLLPFVNGRQLFPLLRDQAQPERELAEAMDELEAAKTLRDASVIRSEAEKVRAEVEPKEDANGNA